MTIATMHRKDTGPYPRTYCSILPARRLSQLSYLAPSSCYSLTPASSRSDLLSLTNLLLCLGPSFSSKLILVGDFNVNNSSFQLNTQLSSLMSLLSLTQHVTDPTQYSHSGIPTVFLLHQPFLSQCPVRLVPLITTRFSLPLLCPHQPKNHHPVVKSFGSITKLSINDHLSSLSWYSILPTDPDYVWSTYLFLTSSQLCIGFLPLSTSPPLLLPPSCPALSLIKSSDVAVSLIRPLSQILHMTGNVPIRKELYCQ